MTASDYPIREIFRRFYPAYLDEHPDLPAHVQKAARSIMRCKTGELGYNVSYCDECGYPRINSVSCNNRNCPCCQVPLTEKWERERTSELIPGISYFHVVFTVPDELNNLILSNEKLLLDHFFKCVNDTLLNLCADSRFMEAIPALFCVLHTWGQKLNFHPHIHVCISGGGITPSGTFRETNHRNFFIPTPVLTASFRGRFLTGLKVLYDLGKLKFTYCPGIELPQDWKAYIDNLFKKPWISFVKETFNGKGNAVKYLARYSFRTAISNSRIISYDNETVTFSYKDYHDNDRRKERCVKGADFIRLFLQHILPVHFNRVRFSGLLANCRKRKSILLVHKLRNTTYPGNPYRTMNISDLIKVLYGKDICLCSECGGRMRFFPRGQPKGRLPLLPYMTFLATS